MWDLENATCHECGQPVEEHGDPQRVWYPLRIVDYASMELAGATALYGIVHEERPFHDGTFGSWAEKRTHAHPYHFNDGVRIVLTTEDMSPHDKFLTDENAVPSGALIQHDPPDDETDHGRTADGH